MNKLEILLNAIASIRFCFTKSKEQWIKRRSQGKVDLGSNDTRLLEEFYAHDNNDILDKSAKIHSGEMKEIMQNYKPMFQC